MNDYRPFDPTHAMDDILRKAKAAKVEAKPLPQIRGKSIDGVLYVRATDVADALETQAASACKRLIDKLRKAAA